MPALDVAGLKASEAAAVIARQAATAAPSVPAHTPPPSAPVMAPPAAAAPTPAPMAAAPTSAAERASATKTIFGVPAPRIPEKTGDRADEKAHEEARAARAAGTATPPAESGPQRQERKTGARKTVVPAPALIPPSAMSEHAAPMTAAPAEGATAEASRTTHQGYGGQASAAEVVPTKAPANEDRTLPVRVANGKRSRGIPVWTYVGVGFLFGLALLGIYQLVGVLAH
jgi:hypothetical protein